MKFSKSFPFNGNHAKTFIPGEWAYRRSICVIRFLHSPAFCVGKVNVQQFIKGFGVNEENCLVKLKAFTAHGYYFSPHPGEPPSLDQKKPSNANRPSLRSDLLQMTTICIQKTPRPGKESIQPLIKFQPEHEKRFATTLALSTHSLSRPNDDVHLSHTFQCDTHSNNGWRFLF